MNFSQMLCYLMETNNVSAYKISKETGISDRLIGYWRSGERQPIKDNIIKLADYFNVSTDYLLGRTDNPEMNQ
ncbi:MAG: helix-turn-helix domain-containing protein [Oscillospiraceae bacterium]|nr:helix-turn-helix domain-containing protein [Oscillospiraceae bacterium]